jgi:hypothetical protein
MIDILFCQLSSLGVAIALANVLDLDLVTDIHITETGCHSPEVPARTSQTFMSSLIDRLVFRLGSNTPKEWSGTSYSITNIIRHGSSFCRTYRFRMTIGTIILFVKHIFQSIFAVFSIRLRFVSNRPFPVVLQHSESTHKISTGRDHHLKPANPEKPANQAKSANRAKPANPAFCLEARQGPGRGPAGGRQGAKCST